MVAGMLRHFKALRKMKADQGWIEKLLEEAENERMHLMTWMKVIEPTKLERVLVMFAQFFYTPFYAALYIFSPYTAHRYKLSL
jgi:ubiquinol oxidase